jgi:hypothetical protein
MESRISTNVWRLSKKNVREWRSIPALTLGSKTSANGRNHQCNHLVWRWIMRCAMLPGTCRLLRFRPGSVEFTDAAAGRSAHKSVTDSGKVSAAMASGRVTTRPRKPFVKLKRQRKVRWEPADGKVCKNLPQPNASLNEGMISCIKVAIYMSQDSKLTQCGSGAAY